MKHVKMFESWLGINEARKFPKNPRYEEDETPDWSNMKDALEEEGPDSEFKDAFEVVMKDSGWEYEDIRFEGVLKGDHDFVGGVKVKTPTGYPGAVTVDKFELGDETLYVLGAYDGDLVFSC